jgi:hypothetical protein
VNEEPIRTLGETYSGPREIPVDDDIAETGAPTTLDALREELTAEVVPQDLVLPVPGRPGYEVRYSLALDGERVQKWRKASANRSMPDGVDELAFAQRLLASQMRAVIRDGEEILDQGEPVTVRTAALLEVLEAHRPVDGVRKLYGLDGHIISTATSVFREAGYGEDLVAGSEDPTARR